MFRNADELFLAIVLFINFHNDKTKDIDDWEDFCKTDKNAKYLSRLFQFYTEQLKVAEKFGYVGVGCITFAENRMREFQRRIANHLKQA